MEKDLLLNNTKIEILFVIPSLVAGGAERVMSFIAQNIDSTKFNVTLIVIGFKKDSAYKINGIDVIYLNKSRVLYSIFPLLKFLVINRPKIVISAIGHLNTVMAYLSIFFSKTMFVAREVNILSVLKSYQLKKTSSFFSFFSKRRFYFFDKIICQSNDMLMDLKENNNIPEKKLVVINNPITDGFEFSERKISSKNLLSFITVARLKKQKGHERIIKTLSKLKFPFKYIIIGDGPEYNNLFALIKKLGLEKQVEHIPYTNKVAEYLAKSDVFLQGSYIEGFPNSVIESCAVGTPVVAFNAPGGINEIIEDGINGYVVNNEEEFIDKLYQINKEYPFNRRLVSDAVFKKYSKDFIIKKYEDAFINLIKRNAKD
jgi:glycosyltransferase involved in cell wall biosynthesis